MGAESSTTGSPFVISIAAIVQVCLEARVKIKSFKCSDLITISTLTVSENAGPDQVGLTKCEKSKLVAL